MRHIVKRKGHSEPYDARKLYASIYASCMIVGTAPGQAELVAERVVGDVEKWLMSKTEVTANDIRHHAFTHFNIYNEDAAYMYKHHRLHHL